MILKPKLEGTSQTYGQLVQYSYESNPVSVEAQSPLTSVSSGFSARVDMVETVGEGFIDPDVLRAQIILAAAQTPNNANAAIAIPAVEVGVATVFYGQFVEAAHVRVVLEESQKVDLSVSTNSVHSQPVVFNTMQTSQPQAKFVYNFTTSDENDILTQEDPAFDPLLTTNIRGVPKYVELTWDIVSVVDQLTEEDVRYDVETEELKSDLYHEERGSTNDRSYGQSLYGVNLINAGTVQGELVDIHRLDTAFDLISNTRISPNIVNSSLEIRNPQEELTDNLAGIVLGRIGR